LFDAGYVTVTPALKFQVSGRIEAEFENGRHYYALHGGMIEPPVDPLPETNACTMYEVWRAILLCPKYVDEDL
jgi:putative restriction endonuclease